MRLNMLQKYWEYLYPELHVKVACDPYSGDPTG